MGNTKTTGIVEVGEGNDSDNFWVTIRVGFVWSHGLPEWIGPASYDEETLTGKQREALRPVWVTISPDPVETLGPWRPMLSVIDDSEYR